MLSLLTAIQYRYLSTCVLKVFYNQYASDNPGSLFELQIVKFKSLSYTTDIYITNAAYETILTKVSKEFFLQKIYMQSNLIVSREAMRSKENVGS